MIEQVQQTGAMKETEIGWLPVEWKILKLGEIADSFMGGGTPSTKHQEYWNGDIHWTTSKRISGIYLFNGEKKITEQGLKKSSTHLIPKDNLIIGTRVGVGKVAINKVDIAISQDLTGVFIDKNKYDSAFLAYQITGSQIQKKIRGCTRGTTIKGIPRDDLKKILLKISPLAEQKNIAAVLSSLQETIEKTEDIIKSLWEFKKSMMRHLFTYGSVSPDQAEQVKLKETEIGMIPVEWEVMKLEQVIQSAQYGLSKRGESKGQYPILRMNNVTKGKVITSNLQFVDLDSKIFQKFKLNKGDVLFNRTNSFELVGKTSLFDLDGDFIFASYLIRVIPDMHRLVSKYLNYYLNMGASQKRLKMLASRGVSQSNINATKLKNFQMPLAPLPIQKQIAQILSSIDAKIQAEEDKKKALQTLFKTLLENLMTGKICVTHLEIPS